MRLRARLLLAAASGSLLFLLAARWLLEYVTPLFLALLVAAAIDPMVDWLESRGVGRRIGALGIIAVFSLAAVGLLWVLAVNVAAELSLLHEQLPGAAREIQALLDRWVKLLQPLVSAVPHPLDDALLETVDAALRGFAGFTAQLLARLGSLPSALATLVLSGMAAYFLIRDKRELGSFWLGLLPGRWRGEARRLKGEIAAGLLGFLRAQTILVAVSGGLSIAGLGLFGYRYAWLLGLAAGIFDLVPMVGPSAVFLPLVAIGVASGEWMRAAGTAAVWLSVLMVRQFVEPGIVRKHVGLHPLTSMIAIYLGGKLLGVNGVLIGPMVAVTLKAISVVSVLPYLKQE